MIHGQDNFREVVLNLFQGAILSLNHLFITETCAYLDIEFFRTLFSNKINYGL